MIVNFTPITAQENLNSAPILIDTNLIANATTSVATLTANERAKLGILYGGEFYGAKITDITTAEFFVAESVTIARTMLRAAGLGGLGADSFATDTAGPQTFNAAGPTAITNLSCIIPANGAGQWLLMLAGNLLSTDAANAGANIRLTRGGVAFGRVVSWGPAQFVGNNLQALGAGIYGHEIVTATAGETFSAQVGVLPGGVGGDDITMSDIRLTALRLT